MGRQRLLSWKRSLHKSRLFTSRDGHHRSAAAGRVFQARKGSGNSAFFLNVIFPHNQVRILPYNRVVKDLNGHTPTAFLEALRAVFEIGENSEATPARRHQLGVYLGGTWRTPQFLPHLTATTNPIEKLDVSLLQKHVLGPVLGIEDPRTSKRLSLWGYPGHRGA